MNYIEIENAIVEYQKDQQKPFGKSTDKAFIPLNMEEDFLLEKLLEVVKKYGANTIFNKLSELK